MRNVLNQKKFEVTFNTAFHDVISNCQKQREKDKKEHGLPKK